MAGSSMTGGATFLLSYENLLKSADLVPFELPKLVQIEREAFASLIKKLLLAVDIDEDWYRKQNPDVDATIATGIHRSAKHHFVEEGYFEGRRAGPVEVDEAWYLAAYPDVAESIELGDIRSAQEHFDLHGYEEGRMPQRHGGRFFRPRSGWFALPSGFLTKRAGFLTPSSSLDGEQQRRDIVYFLGLRGS